jgi:hypothetical protein
MIRIRFNFPQLGGKKNTGVLQVASREDATAFIAEADKQGGNTTILEIEGRKLGRPKSFEEFKEYVKSFGLPFLLMLFSVFAYGQTPQDTLPQGAQTAPKVVTKTLNPIPVSILYKVTTKNNKFVDLDQAVFGSMALYNQDPKKQTEILIQELQYNLYSNNRLPKGFDKGRVKIRIIDIKRY